MALIRLPSSARRWWACVAVSTGWAALLVPPAFAEDAVTLAQNFARLSIEELAAVEITSVSKQSEPLSGAAAAVYVIRNEDIRRSGVNSLPEALRLAPNLQVARITGLSYAVTARGFNSQEASNKLLVLIDGRSVYSSLHSGVFWDFLDVMLEDVERIEVVSGPGGTLWGANAVNGVINIITKRTADSQGGLVSLGIGNLDRDVAARYGGAIGPRVTYRLYAKGFERGPTVNAAGGNFPDDWDRMQGGFAIAWSGEADNVRVQGDLFDSAFEDFPSEISGGNVVARWHHDFGNGSPLDVQIYYDRTRRLAPPGIDETVEAYDLDIQHSFSPADGHSIVWGGGYRRTRSSFVNASPFVLTDRTRTLELGNIFLQDEVNLSETLSLTAGLKLEHHEYTGLEYLPNAKLAWQMSRQTLTWASVSRAVRTPSRIDRELTSRTPGILDAATDFESETLVAYEGGLRTQFGDDATLSVAAFYNVYDDLRTTARPPGGIGPLRFTNAMQGHTYGFEAWGSYAVAPWWRVSAGLNMLWKKLHVMPGVVETSNMQAAGNDPDHQVSIRSQMNPLDNVEFDLALRAVDDLPRPVVPSYAALDARLGWRVTDSLEVSIAGMNLLDARHPEAGAPASRRQVRRSVYARLAWGF